MIMKEQQFGSGFEEKKRTWIPGYRGYGGMSNVWESCRNSIFQQEPDFS